MNISKWEKRVRELEVEGLTRSDAQGVVDVEFSKTEGEHIHSFSVDTSCECGVVLSEYVCNLKKINDELLEACKNLMRTPENDEQWQEWKEQAQAAIEAAEGKGE